MIKYVKHSKVRIKTDIKREKITKVLFEFFEELEEKPTGMKGFVVMDDMQLYTIARVSKRRYTLWCRYFGSSKVPTKRRWNDVIQF
jgi:hypothetical protein